MKKYLQTFASIVLSALLLASCGKSADAPAAPEKKDNAEKVLTFIQNLGFSQSSIVDNGDAYIVDNDIRFPKDMEVPEGKPSTEQKWTGNKVSAANALNIRIKVDPSMTSMMPEINSAVNQWNNIGGDIALHFSVVTGSSYDILIKDADLGATTCGRGTYPSGGKAGNLIQIHKAHIAGNSFAQRQRTITHEMGHNISFTHTNQAGGSLIPGTPATDANSLMNGGQCNSGATVLSNYDKIAARWLY
ncbi:MAG TPA: M57 family metalloprotease [Chitinophaga sp.]|uniref:M57 family metalloprotease n=1 Tax=Chitinophaga sp. TaxID=1869181 RepID=UPI002D059E3B|nr:M57 family metalloprotease [Chitinophaga sp.]HVI45032.1 M57 family metalloprotease [Chitinophaga sp.]